MATAYSGNIKHGQGTSAYPQSYFDLTITYSTSSSGISWSASATGTDVSLYGGYRHYLSLWIYVNGTSYNVINGGLLGYRSYSEGPYNASSTSGSVSTPLLDTGTSATFYVESTFNEGGASGSSHNLNVGTSGYEPTTYTVSLSKGVGIASVSGAGTYNEGASVSISATASTGYTFSGWSGYGTSSSNPYSFTIYQNRSYTANATPNTYTITFSPGTYGTGSSSTLTKSYGTALTLLGRIFTRSGYIQQGWSTSAAGTSKAYELSGILPATTNQAMTLYPYWEATSSGGGGGTTAGGTGTQPYLYYNNTWNKVLPWVYNGSRWYPCGSEGYGNSSGGGGTTPTPPATNSYKVESAGATYTFVQNSSGYYESNNKGVDDSCALCKVTLTITSAASVTFQCINYAENTWDYGLLSKIGSTLSNSTSADSSTYVQHSFYNLNSSSVQTVSYGNLNPGTYVIYAKFIKDESQSSYNDSLQFKVVFGDVQTQVNSSYSVAIASGSIYEFVQGSNGWYASNNAKVTSSFALSKITINANGTDTVYIDGYCDGESSYDFGILSNVNTTLTASNSADSSYKQSFSNKHLQIVSTNYGVLSKGTHTIYVKYKKDTSVDTGTDKFYFKVRFNGSAPTSPPI